MPSPSESTLDDEAHRLSRARNLDAAFGRVLAGADSDRVLARAALRSRGDRQIEIFLMLGQTHGAEGDEVVLSVLEQRTEAGHALRQVATIAWGKRAGGRGTAQLVAATGSGVTRPEALWYLGAIGGAGHCADVQDSWKAALVARRRSKRSIAISENPVLNPEFGGALYLLRHTPSSDEARESMKRQWDMLALPEQSAVTKVFSGSLGSGRFLRAGVVTLTENARDVLDLG